MRLRIRWVPALLFVLVVGVAFSAEQTATVNAVSGSVIVEPGHRTLANGGVVNEGDTVTVAPGATLKLSFPDGASMDVTGPSQFRMRLLSGEARTIDLLSGKINQFVAKAIPTGITTPYDSFVVAQNGTVSAALSETPSQNRATFFLLEGGKGNAKVVDHREIKTLTKDRPIVVDRPKGTAPAALPTSTGGAPGQIDLGQHRILILPKDGFEVQHLPGGGLRLIRTGEGVGVVNVDDQTSFYLYKGQQIQFDSAGNVTSQNGIVHVYNPLDYRGIYDDPIEGPASASFTGSKVK